MKLSRKNFNKKTSQFVTNAYSIPLLKNYRDGTIKTRYNKICELLNLSPFWNIAIVTITNNSD